MPSFREIYENYQHLVYNLCLHYLQNRLDAEEAAQDIFVKIHGKMGAFQEKSALKTWIYRICVNHCIDVLRMRKRQKRLAFLKSIFNIAGEVEVHPPDFDHPGVLLEDREALERLFRHIDSLPEQQKTALILRYLDDLSPPEIAHVLQISVKAVESLLQRAKQNLGKRLPAALLFFL